MFDYYVYGEGHGRVQNVIECQSYIFCTTDIFATKQGVLYG